MVNSGQLGLCLCNINADSWSKEMHSIRAYCQELIRQLRLVPRISHFNELKSAYTSFEKNCHHLIKLLAENSNKIEDTYHLLKELQRFKTTG